MKLLIFILLLVVVYLNSNISEIGTVTIPTSMVKKLIYLKSSKYRYTNKREFWSYHASLCASQVGREMSCKRETWSHSSLKTWQMWSLKKLMDSFITTRGCSALYFYCWLQNHWDKQKAKLQWKKWKTPVKQKKFYLDICLHQNSEEVFSMCNIF